MKLKIVLSVLTLALHFNLFAQCNYTPCAPGNVQMGLHPANTCVICDLSDLDGFTGTSLDFPNNQVLPQDFCGTIENNFWFAFVAPQANVVFDIEVFNCGHPTNGGLQVQIFGSTDCQTQWDTLSNCASPGFEQPLKITATNLEPGEVYYLMFDGFAGDICDFTIEVTEPLNGGGVSIPTLPPPIVFGPSPTCFPDPTFDTYTVNNPASGAFYQWTIVPPSVGVIVSDPTQPEVLVQWTNPGVAQICTFASNACSISSTSCMLVDIQNIPPTTEETDICIGGSTICAGEVFTSPGVFPVVLTSYEGCDSIVNCIVNPIVPSYTDIGQIDLCFSDSYEVCGHFYTQSGIYTSNCLTWQGCDSLVMIDLAIMEPVAHIQPPEPLLFCEPNPTQTLDGTASTFNIVPNGNTSFNWSGPSIISPNDEVVIEVNEPGQYCLELTHERNGVSCSDNYCVDVPAVFGPPAQPVILSPDSLYTGWSSIGYFETPDVPYATSYNWDSGFPGNIIEVVGDTGVFVQIAGFEVCLSVENGCGSSAETCVNLSIASADLTADIVGLEDVCATVEYTYLFETDDTTVTSTKWHILNGNIQEGQNTDQVKIEWKNGDTTGILCVSVTSNDYGNYQRCETVSIFDATNANFIAYDTAACYLGCIVFNNEMLCETDTYEFGMIDNGVCEEIYEIDVSILEAEPILVPPFELNCLNPTVIIDGTQSLATPIQGTNLQINWTGPSIIAENGLEIEVDQEGQYCLEIIHETSWGLVCSGIACVNVLDNVNSDPPTAILYGGGSICEGSGDAVDVIIECSGTAPWIVNWQIDGVPQPPLFLSQSPHQISLNEQNAGLVELTGVSDICGIQGTVSGQAFVEVNPEPLVTNINQFGDASNLGCFISFEIYDPNPIVDPPGSGTLSGFNPVVFTSNLIPNGTGYEFIVTNADNCGPVIVSQNNIICECETQAGEMDLTPIETCAPILVTATYDMTNQVLDPNDVVNFIVHRGSGNVLVDPGPISDVPSFYFNIGAMPGDMYYISAVVGNDTGGGWIDINDPCLQVTQGTPIIITETINAWIEGDTDREICPGDCDQLKIMLEGMGPWEITINGEIINVIASPFIMDVCPGSPNYSYTLETVASQNCIRDINQTIHYFEQPLPTAEISGGMTICEGDPVSAQIELTGSAPWYVEWSLDGVVQAPININASPFTLNLAPHQIGEIALISVTDNNGCWNDANSSTIFNEVDAPQVMNIDIQCNATSTAYVVSFEISGGDPNSYTVTPFNGTLASSPPYIFTGDEIPSGQDFSFVISDVNDCNPVTVEEPTVICDCVTSVGEMDLAEIEECGDGPVTATYDSTNEALDGNDVLAFYLHDNNTNFINNPILVNTIEPTFQFMPGSMNYGQTYYISAVVGNEDGTGQVDLNDPCLAVAQGTPVVFFDAPTAQFVADEIEICEGDFGFLEVEFTGDGPWDLLLDNGSGLIPYGGITTNPFQIQVAPAQTEVFTIIGVGNLDCSTQGGGTATVTVTPNDLKFQAISPDTTICKGDSTQLSVEIAANVEYSWSPANTLSCSDCPDPVAEPVESTNYQVTVTDGSGCTTEENIRVFVQCFEEYDTIEIGKVGVRSLNLPPWIPVQADVCLDAEEHTSIGWYPNGFFYVGLSEGTDTICIPLNHPDPLLDDDMYTIYVTVIKKSIFNFNNHSSSSFEKEGEDELDKKKIGGILEIPPISKDIQLYPNPAKEVLYIVSKNQMLSNVELYDVSGKKVLSQIFDSNSEQLDINSIAPGSYYLKIETPLDRVFRKVVIH